MPGNYAEVQGRRDIAALLDYSPDQIESHADPADTTRHTSPASSDAQEKRPTSSPAGRREQGGLAVPAKFVTANLLAGGIGRSRTDSRFLEILALLAAQRAQVIAAQECLYWHEDDFALFHMAEAALGMRGVLGVEDTGMATAIFVGPPFTIIKSRVFAGGPDRPWRHGATWAEIAAPDGETMHVGSVHMSPGSRTQRMWEAEQIPSWWPPHGRALVGMDTNTADSDNDLSGPGVPEFLRARLTHPVTNVPDTRPTDHLVRSGLVDLAARQEKTRVPTSGIGSIRRDAQTRCIRMFASPTISGHCSDFELIDTGGLSDHYWGVTNYAPSLPASATQPAKAPTR